MLEFIRNIKHSAAAMRRHRATVTELSKLDDRLLRDIGINRSQIPSVARNFDSRRRG